MLESRTICESGGERASDLTSEHVRLRACEVVRVRASVSDSVRGFTVKSDRERRSARCLI